MGAALGELAEIKKAQGDVVTAERFIDLSDSLLADVDFDALPHEVKDAVPAEMRG